MKAVIPIFLIAIAAGVAAFMVLDPLQDRAAAYKEGNERILASMTHLPVARVVSMKQDAYEEEGITSILNRAKGWTLRVVYTVPEGVKSEDVTAFYEQNVPPGWQVQVVDVPSGVDPVSGQPRPVHRNVTFVSGERRVDVNTENMYEGGPRNYEVIIDQKGVKQPAAEPAS